MQVMIVVVYWIALHEFVMSQNDVKTDPVIKFLMYWIHIWPGFAMLMQVVISRFVFIYSMFEYMIKFGVFYMLINCFGAWQRGKPLYPFMPWGD